MILLLTGCINPAGMSYTTLNNPEERKKQYVDAIYFYLSKTNYPIVFSENSGIDISYLFQDYIRSGRLEVLSFCGNQDKKRGKGYGECEIIEYALQNSNLINSSIGERIIKITGRLKIKNIKMIIHLHSLLFSEKTAICAINSDMSFPDSRIIIASKSFFFTFLKNKDKINDTEGYYFEHALCDILKNQKKYPYSPFLILPFIEGISGSSGKSYSNKTLTISFSFKYLKFALSQRWHFYKLYR
jgi:hypothetical protein